MDTQNNTTPDADLALVSAAIARERAAVARLVDRLTPVIQARVARTLLRFHADGRALRQDVEDLTQDVFLTLFADDGKVLRSWEPERGLSLENFIGLVAGRHAVSRMRSGRHNPWRESGAPDGELPEIPDAAGPAELAAPEDLLRQLLQRLEQTLSPLGFHLFRLLYVEQRDVQDVCAEVNMTPDAVYAWRSRLRRAARTLHDELVTPRSAGVRSDVLRGEQP